ncbi:MAG TPA: division/cell wall cluster transcriptional repressor MraZ [Trueperaceae bacterium]|nr:division/cell wall cluster transcriptional repressor MraZ [Trueperaceae bacterium]
MPFGEFQYSVDDKGRVIIPPAFRDFVEDGMVVTRGMDSCLFVFPMRSWQQIEESLTALPLTDPGSRNFVRFFYSGAAKAKLDSTGRIGLPPTLRKFANLEGNVMVVGAPNRLEIWNEDQWLHNLEAVQDSPPAPELLRELIG